MRIAGAIGSAAGMRSKPYRRATSSIRSSSISMSKRYEGGVTTKVSFPGAPSRVKAGPSRSNMPATVCGSSGTPITFLRAFHPHTHGFAFRQARHGVHDGPRLAAADIQDQPGGALDAGDVVVEIDTALETVRRVAGEVIAARTPGDRFREEEGRLQKHVVRVELRLGAVPAHDAGEADRTAGVGDARARPLQRRPSAR
jgi:hypothetical protein